MTASLIFTLPCPGLWYSADDAEEHLCVLLLGHTGDCLCSACVKFRSETEDQEG